ncbi:hypothetical protein GQF01_02885 [Paenibacillus sp. 5J-6]|uniref:Knr4/Smi1-like domain-containing protein n=1 Tax=Paenibacillus silvestris TaxID=2606219 RepID=A0A6L8UVD7_9BACL|nr:SMI1/KNR4 family protein [Paenibacillus silvestris]MZQ81080.1 hypothetical protein [Paenibacillus silvestris]
MLLKTVRDKESLLQKHDVEANLVGFLPKINMSKWEELVTQLSVVLPDTLREIYVEETSGFIFKWNASKEKFGDSCKRGYLHFLSPEEIIVTYREMLEIVLESRCSTEIGSNVGLQALVMDWPNWIPIMSFPNGDSFCIDVKRNLSIVFLEHDVMDGGPYIHGTTIAKNLENLLDLWSQIAFTDVFDWSICCTEDGIDLENPMFRSIRSLR